MTQQAANPAATVTEVEMAAVYGGPSFFINKMYLTATGFTARLTFAEQGPDQAPHFRTSVTMTVEDLLKLRDVINQVASQAVQLSHPTANG